MSHIARMKDRVEGTLKGRDGDDISIAFAHLDQEVERITHQAERILDSCVPARSRGIRFALLRLERMMSHSVFSLLWSRPLRQRGMLSRRRRKGLNQLPCAWVTCVRESTS